MASPASSRVRATKAGPSLASRTAAVQSAERAVTEDRVPRRYHEAVKDYFQQLPEDPNAGKAPAAPR